MSILNGSCLCGSVRYVVTGGVLYSGYCHCSECRKFSGSAFSATAGVLASRLKIVEGEAHLASYRKTPKSTMRFCRKCGSSMFVEKSDAGMIHLRMGTVDSGELPKPMGHVHVASKAYWYEIPNDGLPQVEGGMPESVAPTTNIVAAAPEDQSGRAVPRGV